jgi:hypothetical protein
VNEGDGNDMYQLAEVHVYEIACPRCHAQPGEGCVMSTGRSMELPHGERNRAIREREAKDARRRHPSVPRSG